MSDFDWVDVPHEREQRAPVRHAPPRREALFSRRDVEVVFFALSIAGLVLAVCLARGWAWAEARYAALIAFCSVTAYVYGAGALPLAARGTVAVVTEFRALTAGRVRLAEAEAVAESEPLDHEREWRIALLQFLLAGKFAGSFSIREMSTDRHVTDPHAPGGVRVKRKVVTGTTWRRLMPVAVENGVLAAHPKGMDYAPGFDYGRAVAYLKHESLSLPPPLPPKPVLLP